mgnify:CR=1 FL=1
MALRITTNRRTEEELDRAIANLEKRGYRLIAKKPVGHYRKYYDMNRDNKYVFSYEIETTSWRAILERDERYAGTNDAGRIQEDTKRAVTL